jgi:hypothetical protein
MQLLKDAKDKGQIRKDCELELISFFLNVLSTEFARFAVQKAKMKFFHDIHRPENLHKLEKIDIPSQIKELMKLIQNGIAYDK